MVKKKTIEGWNSPAIRIITKENDMMKSTPFFANYIRNVT